MKPRLVALAATLVTASALVAAPAALASHGTVPGIVDCSGKVVSKPSQIVLTCADDGVSLTKLTWSSWTSNSAKGKGTLVWNTCLPKTCAGGIIQTYPVRITLGGLASGEKVNVFSQVNLTFPQGGPAGLETGRYTLSNPLK